jgi:EmrB/QacA subfamily drug resistance transporter
MERSLTPAPAHSNRRWWALAITCLAVFVTVLDGTIVNVALPSLSRELGASTRQLQWVVDAYLLVFCALLLAAGSLGDRIGRKKVLVIGLLAFAGTSALAGASGSIAVLISARALMGIGAALIFPATLAIITNVFPDPVERGQAIGIWGASSGIAVAAGPVLGGWLLEHFWWGSVFFVNLPIAAIAILGTVLVVPDSRDESIHRWDPLGLLLSTAGVFALVYTIIEASGWGWASGKTIGGFVIAVAVLAMFAAWELRTPEPMLPVRIFRNLRFTAASVSITAAFFALFGFIFLVTQYFQLVREYSPLGAGIRTLPVATAIAVGSVIAPKLVEARGTKFVVSLGLFLLACGFAWIGTLKADTPYIIIVLQMMFNGFGLGFTTAPATESIMGSLSPDKAGIGSAVNDTTRELGGTLGVAVIGSVFTSVYVGALKGRPVFGTLPPDARHAAEESVSAAARVAGKLGAQAPAFLGEVKDSFLSGFSVGCWVAAGVALAGSLFAMRFLPARAHAHAHASEVALSAD